MLLAKGYPDIGWNPIGGERYLDFLRFAVFVNGESGVGGGGTGGRGVPDPASLPQGVVPVLARQGFLQAGWGRVQRPVGARG